VKEGAPGRRVGRRFRLRLILVGLVAAAVGLAYPAMAGSTDGLVFPSREASPYVLPWRAGERHTCTQGNQSWVTHRGVYRGSWDFWMWPGTEVHAARGGTVLRVQMSSRWPGLHHGNHVAIEHDDGTVAIYAHLSPSGARVGVGDRVEQGDVIAEAGLTGRTLYPHLHFHVLGPDRSPMPVSFRDIEEPNGVPRVGRSYVAGGE
jgi:murein DD-endopeptidase MepM/ murein hydrolase activator NlpD